MTKIMTNKMKTNFQVTGMLKHTRNMYRVPKCVARNQRYELIFPRSNNNNNDDDNYLLFRNSRKYPLSFSACVCESVWEDKYPE